MLTNRRHVAATPAAIWAVLADASAYSAWLGDVIDVQEQDPEWPQTGSTFRFRYRWGPLWLRGTATVAEAHPPSHLRLRISRRPISTATLEFLLQAADAGTVLQLTEARDVLHVPLVLNHLVDGYAQARAQLSLARLDRLAASRVRRDPAAKPMERGA